MIFRFLASVRGRGLINPQVKKKYHVLLHPYGTTQGKSPYAEYRIYFISGPGRGHRDSIEIMELFYFGDTIISLHAAPLGIN